MHIHLGATVTVAVLASFPGHSMRKEFWLGDTVYM